MSAVVPGRRKIFERLSRERLSELAGHHAALSSPEPRQRANRISRWSRQQELQFSGVGCGPRARLVRRKRRRPPAQGHVDREKAWWLQNRGHMDVFTEELEQALKIIGLLPGAGSIYTRSPIPDVRRIYLRRVALHLYYTFSDDEVIVRALWGARRERGPERGCAFHPS